MKCITIEHTVDAFEVKRLLDLAKSNWSSLPTWFKQKHQQDKILIGANKLQVETEDYNEEANIDDMVYVKPNGHLGVMPKNKFFELYKDAFES
ncbi:hypothetical protein MMO38_13825 [Acinetobacter sp. NIPH 1852]|uniref:hypothetical protein n=1 Tax=Acinetobacter sp. NIPH 1852 TaxID=2923428 RepID=UPI001F4B1502|nr:hypothetical protein [Acinetobacter sp. NIPH 1852]MCH7309200.1 hypothetical protein [Acinetobacter sp. NIPH 1852]